MFLSDISVRRPVLVTVIILSILILGIVSYPRLGVEFFPEFEIPVITISTAYPGAGPEEVETLVTKPMEDEVSSVEGIRHLESYSREGLSSVIIEFVEGTDTDIAADDVKERVRIAESQLPADAEDPLTMKLDIRAMPIINLAVTSPRPPRELYQIAKEVVKEELIRVPGVASVDLIGGREREIEIALDQSRLAACHLTVLDVARAISSTDLDIPSGHITQNVREHGIRVAGKMERIEDLEKIKIQTLGGRVQLRDLGVVRDTHKEVREETRLNGISSVGVSVTRRVDANTIRVVDAVHKKLRRLATILPPDVSVQIATDDSAFIRESISDVKQNMLIGIVLTSILLYLFLHNFRATLIVALAMPASIVSTLSLIHFAGYSINIMSMMGLALSVGILVNNAILVLENIHRYLELGHTPAEAARLGTGEIALAVASTTVTNLVVFLPIAFMESIVGQIFRQFAMTIVFATILSLFVSLTLTPMLASLWLRAPGGNKHSTPTWLNRFQKRSDRIQHRLTEGYEQLVRTILRRRGLTVAISFTVFLLIVMVLAPLIGSEFFPKGDEGSLGVTVEAPVGSSLETTDEIARKVEESVARIPEKDKVFTRVGRVSAMMGGSSQGVHLAEIEVKMVALEQRDRSTEEIVKSIRPDLAQIPGARISVAPTQTHGGGGAAPIELEISGHDIEELNRIADQMLAEIEDIPGIIDPDTDWRMGKPEQRLRPRQEKLSLYGLTVRDLALMLRASLTGEVASTFREEGDEYDIRVRLGKRDRERVEQVEDIKLVAPGGAVVPLPELVEISSAEGPSVIKRKDRSREVSITANVEGRSIGQIVKEAQERLKKISLPPGYRFDFGGEFEAMQENFPEMGTALLLAIVLTFLSLSGILESFRYSFMVLLVLPLSFAAVLLALLITGNTINLMTLMAMIMLVGLVVNNAIIIIDYTSLLRSQGKSRDEALAEACKVRLRPILMANGTTIIAMIPLALGFGWGAEFRAPMAIVSIGGMIGGGVLALVIIPAIYSLFTRR